MVMNKKGQAIMVGIMVAVIIFIAALQFITPLKELVVEARNPDNLDCGNSSISTGQKSTCIIVDWYMFYIIGSIMAAAIGNIIQKKFRGE